MLPALTAFLSQFPVVTLFGVIGVRYLLGQIPIFRFRLGVAGVLFAGVATVGLFVGHRIMRQPFEKVMGLTCAIHTEPASLSFVILISNSDAPQSDYARVFPVCTVAKIVLAQLLVTRR